MWLNAEIKKNGRIKEVITFEDWTSEGYDRNRSSLNKIGEKERNVVVLVNGEGSRGTDMKFKGGIPAFVIILMTPSVSDHAKIM